MIVGLVSQSSKPFDCKTPVGSETVSKRIAELEKAISVAIAQKSLSVSKEVSAPQLPSASPSFSGAVNTVAKKVVQIFTEIATYPSAVKKVAQIATKSFAAYDLHHVGEIRDRKFTDALKGTVDVIGFYSLFKSVVSLLNFFSKKTLDKKEVLKTLKERTVVFHPVEGEIIAKEIFFTVMQAEDFNSTSEVRDVLRMKLLERKISSSDEIIDGVTIQQKSRRITQIFAGIFFTISDLLDNASTLHKWGITGLADIALNLGNKFQIFAIVVKVSVTTAIGSVASVALFISLGDSSYRIYKQITKIYQNNDPEKLDKAYKKLRMAIIDTISNAADLISTAAPLLFTINPPLVVAFAIIAKGTGLICILLKSESNIMIILALKNKVACFVTVFFFKNTNVEQKL